MVVGEEFFLFRLHGRGVEENLVEGAEGDCLGDRPCVEVVVLGLGGVVTVGWDMWESWRVWATKGGKGGCGMGGPGFMCEDGRWESSSGSWWWYTSLYFMSILVGISWDLEE